MLGMANFEQVNEKSRGQAIKNYALFLDRDGVINQDYGHVSSIEQFDLIPQIDKLIRAAMVNGYKIVVVTNQAGIGKGLYTENDFQILNNYMLELLKSKGCTIDAVYFCPFHPTAGKGVYLKDSFDRKPNPGMLLKAMKDLHLDMSKSILIGDSITDMSAGISASVAVNLIYNQSGKAIKIPKGCTEICDLEQVLDYLDGSR